VSGVVDHGKVLVGAPAGPPRREGRVLSPGRTPKWRSEPVR